MLEIIILKPHMIIFTTGSLKSCQKRTDRRQAITNAIIFLFLFFILILTAVISVKSEQTCYLQTSGSVKNLIHTISFLP